MKFIFSWKKDFTSERGANMRETLFPLEDKLHMFAPPCNILYVLLPTNIILQAEHVFHEEKYESFFT